MTPIYVKFADANGNVEGSGLFKGQPEGHVKVRYPDGREAVMRIDDLPKHWLEQLRRWNNFGRTLGGV